VELYLALKLCVAVAVAVSEFMFALCELVVVSVYV